MSIVTITNRLNYIFSVPSPVNDRLLPGQTKVYNFSIDQLDHSPDLNKAINAGQITLIVTDDPSMPSQSELTSVGQIGGSNIPALVGQQFAMLMENPVSTKVWARVTQDMILAAYAVVLTGNQSLEIGQAVATPAFTATYTRTPVAAVLTDSLGTTPKNVISTPASFTSTGTFTKTVYGQTVVFTLTANDGGPSSTSAATLTWLQKVYHGVAVPGTLNAAFITGLATSALASTRAITLNVTASSTQKIYYAFRTAYGTPTFSVGGFAGGFSLVASAVAVTNAHSVTENYDLWASDNLDLGVTTVVVT